jgi:hypothetical protein
LQNVGLTDGVDGRARVDDNFPRHIKRGHIVCRVNRFLIKELHTSLRIWGVKHVPKVFCSIRRVDRVMKANESCACMTVIDIRGRNIRGGDMFNIVRVLGILGVAFIKEFQIGDELLHRRGPGNARILAMDRTGELFILRFYLTNDTGAVRSEGLGETVINKRMSLLNSVTLEDACCTLWIRRVISRFAVNVT